MRNYLAYVFQRPSAEFLNQLSQFMLLRTCLFTLSVFVISGMSSIASETNAIVIMKSQAEKINKSDVWVVVEDFAPTGILVRLHVAGEVDPAEVKRISLEGNSRDGKKIPLSFMNSLTVNPGKVTFVDFLAKPEAKETLSSVIVKWRSQTKTIPLTAVKGK